MVFDGLILVSLARALLDVLDEGFARYLKPLFGIICALYSKTIGT